MAYRIRSGVAGPGSCRIGVAWSVGSTRSAMEDRHLIQTTFLERFVLCAVFDGHGGDSVARYLEENFADVLANANRGLRNLEDINFIGAFHKMDDKLKEEVPKSQNCGSTACVLVLDLLSKKCAVASVGDSFCLVVAQNGTLVFQTESHNVHGQAYPVANLERVQASGMLNPFYKRITNERWLEKGERPTGINMSRAFGDFYLKRAVQLVGGESVQGVISTPSVCFFELDPTDLIVMGCDGINDHCSNERIGRYIPMMRQEAQELSAAEYADELVRLALYSESTDNLTALVVDPFGKWSIEKGANEAPIVLAVTDKTLIPQNLLEDEGLLEERDKKRKSIKFETMKYPLQLSRVQIVFDDRSDDAIFDRTSYIHKPVHADRFRVVKKSAHDYGYVEFSRVLQPEYLLYPTPGLLVLLSVTSSEKREKIFGLFKKLEESKKPIMSVRTVKNLCDGVIAANEQGCGVTALEMESDAKVFHVGEPHHLFRIVQQRNATSISPIDLQSGRLDANDSGWMLTTYPLETALACWPGNLDPFTMRTETWCKRMATHSNSLDQGVAVWAECFGENDQEFQNGVIEYFPTQNAVRRNWVADDLYGHPAREQDDHPLNDNSYIPSLEVTPVDRPLFCGTCITREPVDLEKSGRAVFLCNKNTYFLLSGVRMKSTLNVIKNSMKQTASLDSLATFLSAQFSHISYSLIREFPHEIHIRQKETSPHFIALARGNNLVSYSGSAIKVIPTHPGDLLLASTFKDLSQYVKDLSALDTSQTIQQNVRSVSAWFSNQILRRHPSKELVLYIAMAKNPSESNP